MWIIFGNGIGPRTQSMWVCGVEFLKVCGDHGIIGGTGSTFGSLACYPRVLGSNLRSTVSCWNIKRRIESIDNILACHQVCHSEDESTIVERPNSMQIVSGSKIFLA
jgi:hypothetical protein